MTASPNLPHSHAIRKSGVLVLSGWGIRVQVHAGHLVAHDGIADERRTIRVPRVNHGLKRLLVIGSDGFVTLEALRWLADQGAAFVMLDRQGKVTAVTGPTASSDSKLRRAQALALTNGAALKISKELISQKMAGQELLARDMLSNSEAVDAIVRLSSSLPTAETFDRVTLIEAHAAKAYWQAWADLPIRWPRKDERRVPEHWKRFGSRISPLTHSPRLAANPPNAILNFLYSILEAESRLSAVAMGLDPGIGFLHMDTPSRDSLACDIMEPIRAKCDAFVLNWLQSEPLRKADFWEDRNGNCRLCSPLAIKLSETANTWRRLVSPVAEYCAQEIWSTVSKSRPTLVRQQIATRLTQRNKRIVKGSAVPEVKPLKLAHACTGCGVTIPSDAQNCENCSKEVTSANFSAGRKSAQQPEYLAKRAATMRRHKRALRDWKPSDLPTWLNRDVYLKQIQPALARVTKTQIRSILGVSEPYSSSIQSGKRVPHPRHWEALARLVLVFAEKDEEF